MKNFQNLYDFIDKAVKNRKYPANTALGLKAALKLFEAEINEDERASIDKFKENLNQIYHGVSTKNKDITASSLATYKSRVAKIIRDYELYGVDPTKINNWSVKPIVTRQKKQTSSSPDKSTPQENDSGMEFNVSANFVFDFRGGIKLIVPRNQKTSDAIADGELKTARQALTKFADEFMGDVADDSKQSGADQV